MGKGQCSALDVVCAANHRQPMPGLTGFVHGNHKAQTTTWGYAMSMIAESETRRQLVLAQYEVNRLHSVMHDLSEGWYVYTDDGEWTSRATQREAEAYAKGCASEGLLAAVVHIASKVQPEIIEDMDAYNGVTPGVDCPAFAHRQVA